MKLQWCAFSRTWKHWTEVIHVCEVCDHTYTMLNHECQCEGDDI